MSAVRATLIAAALGLATAAGCATTPAEIDVLVATSDGVPPLASLRVTITRTSDPSQSQTAGFHSPRPQQVAGTPATYVFPTVLPVTTKSEWAGAVNVTVDGVDINDGSLLATGSTTGTIVASQTTNATLTLTAVATGTPDGGATDGGATD